jgi:hypothetical protein
MTDHSEGLETRIADWLASQGYPLEMQVARAFRRGRFAVRQAEFYVEEKNGASREIDVLASRQKDVDGRLLRVSCVVECKKTSAKPWLVFTDPTIQLAGPARVVQRGASPNGRRFLDRLAKAKPELHSLGLFALPERPGYAVTEAFTTGQDRAYEGLMAVTTATRCLAQSMKAAGTTGVFFPVLVLDGRLFECFLRDDEIAVAEVEQSALVWRNPTLRVPHSIIHIATTSGLPSLIEEASVTADALLAERKILAMAVGRPAVRSRRVISSGPDA